jgi:hypothetical protein
MAVARPGRTTGHIVEIVCALDFKRHMFPAFNKRQISTWVTDLWQLNDGAIFKAHVSQFLRSSSKKSWTTPPPPNSDLN